MSTPKFSAPGRQSAPAGPLASLLVGLVILLAILAILLAATFSSNRPTASMRAFEATLASIPASQLVEKSQRFNMATQTPPCNRAISIIDDTHPASVKVGPGEEFEYSWLLKNTGSCEWNTDYELIFIDGSVFDAPPILKLLGPVGPGETVGYSFAMRAPVGSGTYTATYKLRSDDGSIFGLGDNFNQLLGVSITVSDP